MTRRLTSVLTGLCLILAVAATSHADENKDSALGIVIKSLQTFKGEDAVGEARFKTHLKRENRTEEVRMFRFWKAYRGKDGFHSKTLFFHTFPPQNKTSVLVWSYMPKTGKTPKRWLYMPMFASIEEISEEEAYKIPGGGDPFFYSSVLQAQQLVPRMPMLDTHTLLKTELIDGVDHFVIKSVPNEAKADFKFAHTIIWITKDNYLPVKATYNDGEKTVIVKKTEWEQMDGEWVWKKVVATDYRTGNTTTLTFSGSKINVGLKDKLFKKKSLKKKPKGWF